MNTTYFRPRYVYPPARAVRVIDADTLVVRLPLALDVLYDATLRLARIDGPELHGPEARDGAVARDTLAALVAGEDLYVETYKERRTFARYITEIWLSPDENGDLGNLSDMLLKAGVVKPWPNG